MTEKSLPEQQFANLTENGHDILTVMEASWVAARVTKESPFIAAIKVMLSFAQDQYDDHETFKATVARVGARVMLALAEETEMLAEIKQYAEEQTLESSVTSLRKVAEQSGDSVLQAISQMLEGLANNNSDSDEDSDEVTECDCDRCKVAKMIGGEATKLRNGRPVGGQGDTDRTSMLEGLISNLGGNTHERAYPNRVARGTTLDLEHDDEVDNMIQTGNYAGAISRRMILRGQTRQQATQYVSARQTTLALGQQVNRFLGNDG
jgi:hypothetical protein